MVADFLKELHLVLVKVCLPEIQSKNNRKQEDYLVVVVVVEPSQVKEAFLDNKVQQHSNRNLIKEVCLEHKEE